MDTPATSEAFENVKDQIGVCGIWCGSCVVGNGALRELSSRCKETIEGYHLPEWGPKDVNYDELFRGLESMASIPACAGCRRSGGRENCELRACAAAKGIESCAECQEASSCCHAGLLDHMRSEASRVGIIVEPQLAVQQAPAEWTHRLQAAWPGCLLFLDE